MFWKKKEPEKPKIADVEFLDGVMKLMKLVETRLTKLESEVEQIQIKLRKKAYRATDSDEKPKDEDKDDGFNWLRGVQ